MEAVVLRRFGPPEELVLEELADPAGPGDRADPADRAGPAGPGVTPGTVVISVEFASITFVETQIRAGHPPHPSMAPALPVVLGNGVGGTVAAVGPGADEALLGRRVISTTGGRGGYASRAVVDAAALIPVPPQVEMADATALLADGRTAMALAHAAAVRAGETVLIEAAAGGVGSLLVQLARHAGATVVAGVGSAGKVAAVGELGADEAVIYQSPEWADQVRTAVGAVDVVFDGVGGQVGEAAFGLLRHGGRFMSYGMASGQFARISDAEAAARGVTIHRGAPVSPERMRELSSAALDRAAAGRLRAVIGQAFPLAEAAAAHAAIESRATVGKTLLAACG
jgi:NADPH2:quinone reductase